LDGLAATDVVLKVCRADVGDRAQLTRALGACLDSLPAVRGVFHAAGVLADGPLLELTEASLERAFHGKALGAWHLHELFKDHPLDFFVMFSSATASLGTVGQGAYMAANAFLGGLAALRTGLGLPALCIEWGAWAQGGMATAAAAAGRDASIAGINMIEPEEGTATLMKLIAGTEPQPLVLPFDLRDLIHLYPAALGLQLFARLLEPEVLRMRNSGALDGLATRPELSRPYVAPRSQMEVTIASIWQRALQIERIGVTDPFFELGGDSVFAGQIIMQINKTLGVTVSTAAAFEEFTVEHLARLAEAVLEDAVAAMSDEEAASALGADGQRESQPVAV